jgi:hypothetical protein
MPTRKRPSRAKTKTPTAPKREPMIDFNVDQLSPEQLRALQEKLRLQNEAMFGEKAGVSVYSEEVTRARQAKFEEKTSGIHVISDEWHGQLETGNPFDDTAQPFKEANPDKHFRYLSVRESVAKTRGKRGYQEIRDENGKAVDCAGMRLCWIPKEVHQQRERKKLAAATSALTNSMQTLQEAGDRASVESGGAISAIRDKSHDSAFDGAQRA